MFPTVRTPRARPASSPRDRALPRNISRPGSTSSQPKARRPLTASPRRVQAPSTPLVCRSPRGNVPKLDSTPHGYTSPRVDLASEPPRIPLGPTELPCDHPTARAWCASTYQEGVVYIVGGKGPCCPVTGHTCTMEIYAYRPSSDSWTRMKAVNEIPSRYSHSMVMKDGQLVVYGGMDEKGTPLRDLHAFSLASGKWTKVATSPSATPPMAGHAAQHCDIRNSIIFCGAVDHGLFFEFCFDTHHFKPLKIYPPLDLQKLGWANEVPSLSLAMADHYLIFYGPGVPFMGVIDMYTLEWKKMDFSHPPPAGSLMFIQTSNTFPHVWYCSPTGVASIMLSPGLLLMPADLHKDPPPLVWMVQRKSADPILSQAISNGMVALEFSFPLSRDGCVIAFDPDTESLFFFGGWKPGEQMPEDGDTYPVNHFVATGLITTAFSSMLHRFPLQSLQWEQIPSNPHNRNKCPGMPCSPRNSASLALSRMQKLHDSSMALVKSIFTIPDLRGLLIQGDVVTPELTYVLCEVLQQHQSLTALDVALPFAMPNSADFDPIQALKNLVSHNPRIVSANLRTTKYFKTKHLKAMHNLLANNRRIQMQNDRKECAEEFKRFYDVRHHIKQSQTREELRRTQLQHLAETKENLEREMMSRIELAKQQLIYDELTERSELAHNMLDELLELHTARLILTLEITESRNRWLLYAQEGQGWEHISLWFGESLKAIRERIHAKYKQTEAAKWMKRLERRTLAIKKEFEREQVKEIEMEMARVARVQELEEELWNVQKREEVSRAAAASNEAEQRRSLMEYGTKSKNAASLETRRREWVAEQKIINLHQTERFLDSEIHARQTIQELWHQHQDVLRRQEFAILEDFSCPVVDLLIGTSQTAQMIPGPALGAAKTKEHFQLTGLTHQDDPLHPFKGFILTTTIPSTPLTTHNSQHFKYPPLSTAIDPAPPMDGDDVVYGGTIQIKIHESQGQDLLLWDLEGDRSQSPFSCHSPDLSRAPTLMFSFTSRLESHSPTAFGDRETPDVARSPRDAVEDVFLDSDFVGRLVHQSSVSTLCLELPEGKPMPLERVSTLLHRIRLIPAAYSHSVRLTLQLSLHFRSFGCQYLRNSHPTTLVARDCQKQMVLKLGAPCLTLNPDGTSMLYQGGVHGNRRIFKTALQVSTCDPDAFVSATVAISVAGFEFGDEFFLGRSLACWLDSSDQVVVEGQPVFKIQKGNLQYRGKTTREVHMVVICDSCGPNELALMLRQLVFRNTDTEALEGPRVFCVVVRDKDKNLLSNFKTTVDVVTHSMAIEVKELNKMYWQPSSASATKPCLPLFNNTRLTGFAEDANFSEGSLTVTIANGVRYEDELVFKPDMDLMRVVVRGQVIYYDDVPIGTLTLTKRDPKYQGLASSGDIDPSSLNKENDPSVSRVSTNFLEPSNYGKRRASSFFASPPSFLGTPSNSMLLPSRKSRGQSIFNIGATMGILRAGSTFLRMSMSQQRSKKITTPKGLVQGLVYQDFVLNIDFMDVDINIAAVRTIMDCIHFRTANDRRCIGVRDIHLRTTMAKGPTLDAHVTLTITGPMLSLRIPEKILTYQSGLQRIAMVDMPNIIGDMSIGSWVLVVEGIKGWEQNDTLTLKETAGVLELSEKLQKEKSQEIEDDADSLDTSVGTAAHQSLKSGPHPPQGKMGFGRKANDTLSLKLGPKKPLHLHEPKSGNFRPISGARRGSPVSGQSQVENAASPPSPMSGLARLRKATSKIVLMNMTTNLLNQAPDLDDVLSPSFNKDNSSDEDSDLVKSQRMNSEDKGDGDGRRSRASRDWKSLEKSALRMTYVWVHGRCAGVMYIFPTHFIIRFLKPPTDKPNSSAGRGKKKKKRIDTSQLSSKIRREELLLVINSIAYEHRVNTGTIDPWEEPNKTIKITLENANVMENDPSSALEVPIRCILPDDAGLPSTTFVHNELYPHHPIYRPQSLLDTNGFTPFASLGLCVKNFFQYNGADACLDKEIAILAIENISTKGPGDQLGFLSKLQQENRNPGAPTITMAEDRIYVDGKHVASSEWIPSDGSDIWTITFNDTAEKDVTITDVERVCSSIRFWTHTPFQQHGESQSGDLRTFRISFHLCNIMRGDSTVISFKCLPPLMSIPNPYLNCVPDAEPISIAPDLIIHQSSFQSMSPYSSHSDSCRLSVTIGGETSGLRLDFPSNRFRIENNMVIANSGTLLGRILEHTDVSVNIIIERALSEAIMDLLNGFLHGVSISCSSAPLPLGLIPVLFRVETCARPENIAMGEVSVLISPDRTILDGDEALDLGCVWYHGPESATLMNCKLRALSRSYIQSAYLRVEVVGGWSGHESLQIASGPGLQVLGEKILDPTMGDKHVAQLDPKGTTNRACLCVNLTRCSFSHLQLILNCLTFHATAADKAEKKKILLVLHANDSSSARIPVQLRVIFDISLVHPAFVLGSERLFYRGQPLRFAKEPHVNICSLAGLILKIKFEHTLDTREQSYGDGLCFSPQSGIKLVGSTLVSRGLKVATVLSLNSSLIPTTDKLECVSELEFYFVRSPTVACTQIAEDILRGILYNILDESRHRRYKVIVSLPMNAKECHNEVVELD